MASSTSPRESILRPISAGVVSALVAFTSSFIVVLTGLSAVGASPDQASSGLLAVSVTMGLGCIILATWTRLPITVAWSTPGRRCSQQREPWMAAGPWRSAPSS